MKFKLDHQDKAARACTIEFDRGVIKTPVFMPVGTYGSVKCKPAVGAATAPDSDANIV